MTERTFPCNELIKRDCGMMPLYALVMLVHSAVFNQNQYKAGVNFLAPPLSLSLSSSLYTRLLLLPCRNARLGRRVNDSSPAVDEHTIIH